MKKHLLNLALFCGICFSAFAQDTAERSFFQLGLAPEYLPEDVNTFIFGDNTQVRKAPSLKGERIALLAAGTPVQVLEHDTAMLTLNGRKAAWQRIRWSGGEGWVWSALLAQASSQCGQQLFMLGCTQVGIKKTEMYEFPTFQYTLKILEAGSIKGQYEFKDLRHYESEIVSFAINNSRGLPDVDNVVEFHLAGACCGCGSESHYVLWSKGQFQALPSLSTSGEMGMGEAEQYFFPEDKAELEQYDNQRYKFMLSYMLEAPAKPAIIYYKESGYADENGVSMQVNFKKMIFDGKSWKKPIFK